jgi:hypothetical protein
MARRKTAQPPPFEAPTLRDLNDAFLLFFDYSTPEGVSLQRMLAHLPAEEELARRHRAALAFRWTGEQGLRHAVRERFGAWGPAALERVADWLAVERRRGDPWGIRLDELRETLLPGVQARRRGQGAPAKYPQALEEGLRLLTKRVKDCRIHRLCREKFGEVEPVPENAEAFMRTVRRHARRRRGPA